MKQYEISMLWSFPARDYISPLRSANSVTDKLFHANVISDTCALLHHSSHGLSCWCSKGRKSVSFITSPCALESEYLSLFLPAAPRRPLNLRPPSPSYPHYLLGPLAASQIMLI